MNAFLSGAILLGYWAIGLFFSHFWRTSSDRFFGFFAIAFWMLAAERLLFVFMTVDQEMRPYVYLIRLAAFLFILFGILDKNRGGNSPKSRG